MTAQQIKALEATQRANETRAKNDAAIIADLLDDERETLVEKFEGLGHGRCPASLPRHPGAVTALVRAGLVERYASDLIELTPRGVRIARRL